jgi:hypothetical protein
MPEDESVLLQVSERYSCIKLLDLNLYLQLGELEKNIWGFIYQCSNSDYLLVFNEELKGKNIRRVYKEALKIINSNETFIDNRIIILKEDNFKNASFI